MKKIIIEIETDSDVYCSSCGLNKEGYCFIFDAYQHAGKNNEPLRSKRCLESEVKDDTNN